MRRMTSASVDLSFFAIMAKTERRMNVGAAVSLFGSLVWAWFTARYVTDHSSSVALNLVLIWAQWGLLLLSGCWAGLRLSSLLFGSPWRQRVLMGEAVPTDLTEEGLVQGFSDNRAPFFGLLAGTILLSWGAVQLTTDHYLTRYNHEGYYATMLRSEAPTEQVAALQQVCGVLAAETRAARPVRERVAYLVVNGDAEVKPWAIWAAGKMGIRSVEGELLAALAAGDDAIRAEAALAVTRLELPAAGPALLAALPAVITTPRTARAYLQAVSRLRLPDAGRLLLPLVDLMAPEVRIAAWRAIGRSGDLNLAPQLWARFEAATAPMERCAIADALKFLSTADQLAAMGSWFDARPRRGAEACAPVALSDRPLRSGDRPDSFEELEAETLRTKMMIAIFNIAGPGTDAWVKELSKNPEESPDVRAKGREILKLLEHAAPRTERRVGEP